MTDSLAAFAAAHAPRVPRCVVCDLPAEMLKQVNAAPAAGISYTVIEKWSKVLGHPVTRHQLGRHHTSGHAA